MRKLIVCLLTVTCVGCLGVKFDSVNINMPLPSHFKNRNLYGRTDIWRFKLTELVGHVLHWDPKTKSYDRTKRIVKEGYRAKLELIEESMRKVYYSLVDSSHSAEGSYLLFTAGLNEKQMASIDIEDLSLVFINDDDVPLDELLAEANRQKQNPNIRRYWIQGVLLASVKTDYLNEIDANASGVMGETLGAKGKVYNKQVGTTRDFRISLELVDIDRLADKDSWPMELQRLSFEPEELAKKKTLLEHSRIKGLLLKEIK